MSLVSRRGFIAAGVAGFMAVTLIEWKWIKSLFDHVESGPWDGLPVLSRSEWRTVSFMADTILPKTAGPSATEAGVLDYLAKMFSDQLPMRRFGKASVPFYARYSMYYRKLIARIDEISGRKFGKPFHSIAVSERHQVLEELSSRTHGQVGYRVVGLPSVADASDSELFSLARSHVMQGYFSDPKYGGNRNYLAWESIRHICHFNYPKDKASCPPHTM